MLSVKMLSVMSDIDQYKDETPYNPNVCDLIVGRMGTDEGIVTADNYDDKEKNYSIMLNRSIMRLYWAIMSLGFVLNGISQSIFRNNK